MREIVCCFFLLVRRQSTELHLLVERHYALTRPSQLHALSRREESYRVVVAINSISISLGHEWGGQHRQKGDQRRGKSGTFNSQSVWIMFHG
ncbi:MAG: hypothetical protein H0X14_10825 [Acidobacteria bacterium]|nr:hypothetical protein [Acidobacteriota bacterium]